MKKILYVTAAALLLQACSTGNTFSKKRYKHLKWIDHDTQVEVPAKETGQGSREQAGSTEQDSRITAPVERTDHLSPSAGLQQPLFSPVPTTSAPQPHPHHTSDSPETITREENNGMVTTPAGTLEEEDNRSAESFSPLKDVKEGSTGELLLMAVLIALILVLFFLLDSALGGILSLILIIFLILVLLRYLGVI